MWPFKRKTKITAIPMEEYAKTRPVAPCGIQKEHVFWTEIQGMPCPMCAAQREIERKEQDENRMADKIAEAVVRKMAEPSNVKVSGTP